MGVATGDGISLEGPGAAYESYIFFVGVAGESDGVGKMTWLGGEKMDNVNSW